MKKFLTAGLLAGGLILSSATGAIAHAASVSHVETCPEGVTQTVVTFDNDYNGTATVSYRWASSGAFSTASLAAKTGDTKPKVALLSHDVGTLTYFVTWNADSFRQPTSGNSTLTIGPLSSCQATTTTSSSTTTSTVPTTTSSSTSTSSTSSTSSTTTTTAAPVAPTNTAQVLGVQLTQPAPAPAVVGPTPTGGVQTGAGGTADSSSPLLPLALGLAGIGPLAILATGLRRQAV